MMRAPSLSGLGCRDPQGPRPRQAGAPVTKAAWGWRSPAASALLLANSFPAGPRASVETDTATPDKTVAPLPERADGCLASRWPLDDKRTASAGFPGTLQGRLEHRPADLGAVRGLVVSVCG